MDNTETITEIGYIHNARNDQATCSICHSGVHVREDSGAGSDVCTNCGSVQYSGIFGHNPVHGVGGSAHDSVVDSLLPASTTGTRIGKYGHSRYTATVHNRMSMPYTERARYHMFVKISNICKNMPQAITEYAKYLYTVLTERKLSRGVVRKGLIVCCVFHACVAFGVPRSFRELSNYATCSGHVVTVSAIIRSNKIFLNVMKDVVQDMQTSDKCESVNEPLKCGHILVRCCAQLDIPEKHVERQLLTESRKILKDLEDRPIPELIGRSPIAVASALIAYVYTYKLRKRIAKTTISESLQVSVVTINKIVTFFINYYKHGE